MRSISCILNTLLLFIVTTSITFCTIEQAKDPIRGFKLGSLEYVWKDHVRELVDRRKLEEKNINTRIEGNVIRDNTKYYFMFLNTGSDSMKVDFTLNPDGFYFGKLRSIEIDLIQDTSETRKAEVEDATKTNRFRVFATTKKRIDNIYDYFKEYYGRPDNSIQKHKETGISYMSAFGFN